MIYFSSYDPVYLLLPVIGLIIGLFGTMLGGGGGFFFLPVLTLLIGVPPHIAVATSLAATLPIGLVGSLGHYYKGNMDMRTGLLFAAAGMVGAFLGAGITGYLSGKQLKVAFGVYSILIALNMMVSTWRKTKAAGQNREKKQSNLLKLSKGSFFGISAGLISGTFGTSGTAPVIAGLFSMRLPVKLVVGTSLLVVLFNTIFAVGAHFFIGKIDLTVIGFLTIGSLIGAFAGPRLLAKVKIERSEKNIPFVYAVVVAAVGVLMIISK